MLVHDDLDLPFGEIRFRFGGGTAGHKGLESIVRTLQTNEFYRVRVGIGKPEEKERVVAYVLEPFRSNELSKLPELIRHVHIGVRQLIEEGLAKAQESFHRRVLV
jgi:PTH1 family peptidyl-tRNA hydrolase